MKTADISGELPRYKGDIKKAHVGYNSTRFIQCVQD